MPVTIHLGAHKTATTHLQTSLRAALPRLAAAGVWYADMRHLRGRRFPLVKALEAVPTSPPLRPKVAQVLDRAAESWPELLLSDENILGGTRRGRLMGPGNVLYPAGERRLAVLTDLLHHRPATLFLSVREPTGFLGSAFAMQVAAGNELELPGFLRGFDPERLSWSGLAAALLEVPGVAGMVAWRYEDYRALRPALLARLLPPGVAATVGDPPATNIGMSQRAYDELRRQVAADPDADRGRLATRLRREFPRRADQPGIRVFDDATRARCTEAYAEDLAQLAALPGVQLLRP